MEKGAIEILMAVFKINSKRSSNHPSVVVTASDRIIFTKDMVYVVCPGMDTSTSIQSALVSIVET